MLLPLLQVPQHLAKGQIVLGLSETFDNGAAVYMRGQITNVVQNGTDSATYVFQSQADLSKPVTLLAGEILVDSPANISDVRNLSEAQRKEKGRCEFFWFFGGDL